MKSGSFLFKESMEIVLELKMHSEIRKRDKAKTACKVSVSTAYSGTHSMTAFEYECKK